MRGSKVGSKRSGQESYTIRFPLCSLSSQYYSSSSPFKISYVVILFYMLFFVKMKRNYSGLRPYVKRSNPGPSGWVENVMEAFVFG